MAEKEWDQETIEASELHGFIRKHGKPLHTQSLGNKKIAVFYAPGTLSEDDEDLGVEEVPTQPPEENPTTAEEKADMKASVEYEEEPPTVNARGEVTDGGDVYDESEEVDSEYEGDEGDEEEDKEPGKAEADDLPEDPEVRHTMKSAGLLDEAAVRAYYDEHGNLTDLKGIGPVTEGKIKKHYGLK
jgi:hypothetical protein